MTKYPHEHWMSRALQLAERGRYSADPNPRVGCVLVRDGQLVGEGWHQKAGDAHAEVMALRAAGNLAYGATCYVTLEPCCHHGKTPPCTQALIEAGVARVIIAMEDPNPRVAGEGRRRLETAGIAVELGVLVSEARAINPGFVKRMQEGLPWVRVKMAVSLDGRTAMASGESQWVTGLPARLDVQRLRARSSAIVTGIGTVLADDCALTVRIDDWNAPYFAPDYQAEREVRQPLRVIVDSQGRLTEQARILHQPGSVLWVQHGEQMEENRHLGHARIRLPGTEGRPDLTALLKYLAREQEVNEVLVEAGPTLAGAVAEAELVDEWYIYMAPKLMGSEARPLATLSLETMQHAHDLAWYDVRRIGDDLRIIARAPQRAGN